MSYPTNFRRSSNNDLGKINTTVGIVFITLFAELDIGIKSYEG